MEKQTVFVTGATGLLGSHLLYFLLKQDYRVIALRRVASCLEDVNKIISSYPGGELLYHQINWVEGDVLDKKTMEESVREAAIVYHCAAVVSFAGMDKELLHSINLQGTENVSDLCFLYGVRLCYVSSIAALGDPIKEGDLIDEETAVIPWRKHSEYSRSKGEAEKIVWEYIYRGLNGIIVCPSIILGAARGRSSSQLFLKAAGGIPFYTRGVCGYVDVRDVCELMIRLAGDCSVRGERFVLNGGNYSYRELFSEAARINGKQPPRWYMPPWMTELAWRLLAVVGKIKGKKPVFTRETARTAQHLSYYSNEKILRQYPDFCFRSLTETMEYMQKTMINIMSSDKKQI